MNSKNSLRNIIKLAKGKSNSSPRANTQEVSHRKNKNSTFGKNRMTPKEKDDDYLRKNSAININSIKNDTNIKLSLNSETTNNCISNNVSKTSKTIRTEAQFLEIINNKNKEIKELERKIKKEKLSLMAYLKKGNCKNTNTSLNSFNLSKTRSSTNFTERNIFQINSFCNSKMKIKTSYPLPGARRTHDSNTVNKSKMRPKSDDYKKPKNNNFNKQQKNYIIYYNSQRAKMKSYTNNFVVNYKRCNSSKQKNSTDKCNKNNNNINNIVTKNNINTSVKFKTLSVDETREIFDNIYNRYKQVLEVLKMGTIESEK